MSKTLLPRDAARVINGLVHLPIDLMRAIAVLDDTTEIGGEVIPYAEQQEMIVSGEPSEVPEQPEEDGNMTEGVQELEGQPAETGPEAEELPEEEAPENETTEEAKTPIENIGETQPELEETPRYESIEDVLNEGDKYFQNATAGLFGISNELDLLKYGLDLSNDLVNLTHDIREPLPYTTFLGAYNSTGTYGDFEEDLKNYSAGRIELDKKYQRYMADNELNESEAQELWKDIWDLQQMNSKMRTGISAGENAVSNAWGRGGELFDPSTTESGRKLFGDKPGWLSDEQDKGTIDEIWRWMGEDYNILSEAQAEVEQRQRELGVRQ